MKPSSSMPMESPLGTEEQLEPQDLEGHEEVETRETRVQTKRHDGRVPKARAQSKDKSRDGSPLPSLPKETDEKQPAITSFFIRTSIKKLPESAKPTKETQKQKRGERKKETEKENKKTIQEKEIIEEDKEQDIPLSRWAAAQKQEAKKMVPRKLDKPIIK